MNNNDRESSSATEKSDRLEEIKETGSILTHSPGGAIQCLTIIGQIEGHYLLGDNAKATKYEHIIPMLAGVEESPEVGGLLVILNTIGGDVEAGLALAELIAGMKKPSVSIVLGGGHSIGVPLAVAAKRSFIVPSATMTIHPVRTNGLVVGVPQSFECLKKMQDRICDFIVRNSRVKPEKLRELMMRTDEIATDVGSIIDGDEAVKIGLIDEIGGLSAALEWLHASIGAKPDSQR